MNDRPDLTEWLRETATLHIASNHYESLLQEAVGTAADRIESLEAENRALRDREKALEEALAPLREFAAHPALREKRDTDLLYALDDLAVLIGDVRRAAAILGDGT